MDENKESAENIAEDFTPAADSADETAQNIQGTPDDAVSENTQDSQQQTQNSMKKFIADLSEIAESALISVFSIMLICTFFLHPVAVDGTSMTNTLKDKDKVFMNTVCPSISYGDIVVINNDKSYLLDENNEVVERDITGSPLNECIIKRVIAKGGQTIEIKPETHEVIVDGKTLDEPYIKEPTNSAGTFNYPITVPDGYYFVMGDNRNGSADSRNPDVGLIKRSQIYGQAVVRFSPFSEFKFLTSSYKHSSD